MKDNYCDYSSIITKEQAIYDFCLYTPTLLDGISDNDGWVDQLFYVASNQSFNNVPKEVSDMDLAKLEEFFKKAVPDDGLIVEIGVWRNPNSPSKTSTQLFLDLKTKKTQYVGIDIEPRPHVLTYTENAFMLQVDSADTKTIQKVIQDQIRKPIDFLFIDGLHSVEQVKKELALIPLVRKGGVIGFHDISFHAGPNVWMDAFDPEKFDIYKFRADDDWGIGFLVKKF
jgi:cephalosporin hydroxylase